MILKYLTVVLGWPAVLLEYLGLRNFKGGRRAKSHLGGAYPLRCVVTSQGLMSCKKNFAPIIHPSISYHCVGVQDSDTKIMPSFGQLFWTGIINISQEVATNIGALNEWGRWMESRDQVMAFCGLSMHSNHSKLSDIVTGKPSVKSQFIIHNSN